MINAGHHTMLNRTVKYPWDYRVKYFQVATVYPLFECGPLTRYNENWLSADTTTDSPFQVELLNNLNGWVYFSFPNPTSQDQKVAGNYGNFTVYPYSNRYNFGLINGWRTNPTTAQVSSMSATNTLTKGFIYSDGSNTVRYGVAQGSNSWSTTCSTVGTRFRVDRWYPILLYDENGEYQVMRVSVGTRFYESGFDFNMAGENECHVRFVPCMKDGIPYICEMNSGTMIPNTMSGTVTAGPQVPDDYESYQQGGGE